MSGYVQYGPINVFSIITAEPQPLLPLSYVDRVIFFSNSGTANFAQVSIVPGYQSMASANAIIGRSYGYAAQLADLSQWEVGYGVWTGGVITRTVLYNYLGTKALVNFTSAPQVMITALAESLAGSVVSIQRRVVNDVPNSTTTLATATGLSVPLASGLTYSVEAELSWTDAAAGGIQAALVSAAGLTASSIIYDGYIIDSAANGIKGNAQATALGGIVASAATTGTAGHLSIFGTITVNVAGTLNVQFAQNTSNATATTIKAGSYMLVYQIP